MGVFDPFGDYESRGYLRNHFGEKKNAYLKILEARSFNTHFGEALRYLQRQKHLTFTDVKAVHKQLFQGVYPWAGEDRSQNAPNLHITKMGIGFQFAPVVGQGVDFVLHQAADHRTMRAKPGEILGNLAYAHPFLDGNGRTILTLYVELCRRANFHIDWPQTNKKDYLNALTQEINDPGKGYLDHYLAPYIRDGALLFNGEKALRSPLSD